MLHLVISALLLSGANAFVPMSLWGDGMVLQFRPPACPASKTAPGCPEAAKVFGSAATQGEVISLRSTGVKALPNPTYNATVLRDGTWFMEIAADEGGPFDLELSSSSGQRMTASDVFFGDVIICSGQSNMEFPLQSIDDGPAVVAAACSGVNIKLFSAPDNATFPVPHNATTLSHEFPGNTEWQTCSSAVVGSFSAICYLSAFNLLEILGEPAKSSRHIGLIQSAKGGTPVEGWCPPDALERCDIEPLAFPIPMQTGDTDPSKGHVQPNVSTEFWAHPSTLFNQMVGPLLGYSVRSFLWYQGEANMNEGFHLSRHNYYCLFSSMIQSWRVHWRDRFVDATAALDVDLDDAVTGGMGVGFVQPFNSASTPPFSFVQLHACDDMNEGQQFADFSNYGDIRMAQDDTERFVGGTGMAVSFDRGHVGIHSPHKKDVGRRLALKLWSTAYQAGQSQSRQAQRRRRHRHRRSSSSGGSGSGSNDAQQRRVDGPELKAACVATAPTDKLPKYPGTNVTQVFVALANVSPDGNNGNIGDEAVPVLKQTFECGNQSPVCCNSTGALPDAGVAIGVAQICVGDVWRGQQWYDASILPVKGGLMLTADLKDNRHSWGQEDAPVWQVRFSLGAFPGCAVYNQAGSGEEAIPMRPFGPVAVSPACDFSTERA